MSNQSNNQGVLFLRNVNGEPNWFKIGFWKIWIHLFWKIITDGKYVGQIENGEPNGQGSYTYPDGGKYEGKWKNGENWNGIEYDKDGNIYGKYVNGEWIKQYPPLILHSQRHSKYPPLNSSQVRHTLHVKSSNIDTPGKF